VNATLQPQRWPLIAFLAVFFLALMAALAPGVSELDLSGIGGDTSRGSKPAAREAWTMMRSADAAV
jgi:hypothetical protein